MFLAHLIHIRCAYAIKSYKFGKFLGLSRPLSTLSQSDCQERSGKRATEAKSASLAPQPLPRTHVISLSQSEEWKEGKRGRERLREAKRGGFGLFRPSASFHSPHPASFHSSPELQEARRSRSLFPLLSWPLSSVLWPLSHWPL